MRGVSQLTMMFLVGIMCRQPLQLALEVPRRVGGVRTQRGEESERCNPSCGGRHRVCADVSYSMVTGASERCTSTKTLSRRFFNCLFPKAQNPIAGASFTYESAIVHPRFATAASAKTDLKLI